jgi:hypothetical protein
MERVETFHDSTQPESVKLVCGIGLYPLRCNDFVHYEGFTHWVKGVKPAIHCTARISGLFQVEFHGFRFIPPQMQLLFSKYLFKAVFHREVQR